MRYQQKNQEDKVLAVATGLVVVPLPSIQRTGGSIGELHLEQDDEEQSLETRSSTPSWIHDLGDVNPFERQMPFLFPYHISTGFGDAGRRTSGSTMSIETTAPIFETMDVENRKARLDQVLEEHIRIWLQQAHAHYLEETRRVNRTPRHYANPPSIIADGINERADEIVREGQLGHKLTSLTNTTNVGLAQIHQENAILASQLQDPDKARNMFIQHVQLSPPKLQYNTRQVADTAMQLGDFENDQGNYGIALDFYNNQHSGALNQTLIRYNPLTVYQNRYGRDHVIVGKYWIRKGRALLNATGFSTGALKQKKKQAREALNCLERGLGILKANLGPDVHEVGEALYLIGHAQLAAGSPNAALERLGECLKIRTQQERQQESNNGPPLDGINASIKVSETLRAIAMVHQQNGAVDLAKGCYEDCERIARKLDIDYGQRQADLARTYLCRGHMHSSSHRDADSLEYAREMYENGLCIAEELQEPRLLAEALVAIGDYCCLVGEEEQALSYYQQAHAVLVPPVHFYQERLSLVRGILRFRRAETVEAIAELGEFVKTWAREDEAFVMAMLSMGVCHAVEGHGDQARVCYKKALALANRKRMLYATDAVAKKGLQRLQTKMNERASFGKVFGNIKRSIRMNSIQE